MVRIGDVWDSATDVLAGRGRLLAPVALLAFVVPNAVSAALRIWGGASPGVAALGALVALFSLLLVMWGQLTVVAVSSDPATTRDEAGALALRRLPRALLVLLIVIAAAIAALIPPALVLWATGFDFRAAAVRAGSASSPSMAPGAALFCFLWGLLLFAVGLWLGARLFLTNAVIVNENRGLGAIGRSVELTRGLTWRLIGVAILFAIVYLVAAWAAQAVVFLLLRLLLGPAQVAAATWFAALADALIGAAFNVVVAVFGARLYAAVTGGRVAAPAA